MCSIFNKIQEQRVPESKQARKKLKKNEMFMKTKSTLK